MFSFCFGIFHLTSLLQWGRHNTKVSTSLGTKSLNSLFSIKLLLFSFSFFKRNGALYSLESIIVFAYPSLNEFTAHSSTSVSSMDSSPQPRNRFLSQKQEKKNNL